MKIKKKVGGDVFYYSFSLIYIPHTSLKKGLPRFLPKSFQKLSQSLVKIYINTPAVESQPDQLTSQRRLL